jgi:NAD(P)-dependent dehydrogenase (short-subunit alcohol dehydrogenase family)
MSEQDHKAAIVTGGSQGIGAGLVAGYRRLGWAVVATSRTIKPAGDPAVLTVDGDVSEPATADRIISGALESFGRIATLADYASSSTPSVLTALTRDGLASATKSLAIECAFRGIRVNAVSPGIIQTLMHPAESHAGLGAQLPPVGHVGQVSDIVDGILFLESSPFITGEILHIDGGQIAGH